MGQRPPMVTETCNLGHQCDAPLLKSAEYIGIWLKR